MEIYFADKKLENLCNDQAQFIRKHGRVRFDKLTNRLNDLKAAETLADMRYLPGRCHLLTGNLAGKFALDLDHPYRLIFEPNHQPIPLLADGGIDWNLITAVTILTIEDYHK